MRYKIFYACNGFDKELIESCKASVLSANNFLKKEDIIVSFHPEYSLECETLIKDIEKHATVIRKNEHIGKPFNIHPLDSRWNGYERYYGEKINIKDVDSENVLLLDCDTLILKDPITLFKGDFDFGGVATDLISTQWQSLGNYIIPTKRVFKFLNRDDIHMWSGAYCVFKNYFHKKIGDMWLDYFNNKRDLLDFTCANNRKTYDQSALIPAVHINTNKVKILNQYIKNIKNIDNLDNIPNDTVIIHGNNLSKKLNEIQINYNINDEIYKTLRLQVVKEMNLEKNEYLRYLYELTYEEYKIFKNKIKHPINILDLGCGLGRSSIYLNYRLNYKPKFIMADSTNKTKSPKYGFSDYKNNFYNNLETTKLFCNMNGLFNLELFDLQNRKITELRDIDLVYSFLSAGFHYPIEYYIDDLLKTTTRDCVFIFGIRDGKYTEETFKDKFKKISISDNVLNTREKIMIMENKYD